MTATIGHASLFVAFFVALWGISASIIGPRTTTERFFVSVKVAILAQFFLVTLASLALIYALVTTDFSIKINEGLSVGRYYIQFEGLRGSQQPTHYRVQGSFRVFNEGHDLGAVSPTLKFFPNQQSPIGRAVFRSTLADDLYLILSGFSDLQEGRATLKVLIRPPGGLDMDRRIRDCFGDSCGDLAESKGPQGTKLK